MKFEGDWLSCDQIFVCADNLEGNIWSKIQKFSKIEQAKKSLISIPVCVLAAITKV